jgi:DNA polymerase III delta subunit
MKVIHGEDVVSSRKLLNSLRKEAKEKGLQVVALTGSGISLGQVKQAVETGGLFGSDQLLIIEGLFTGASSKAKTEVIAYLKIEKPEMVIIWEGKKIDGRKLTAMGAQVSEYKVNSKIFTFLEAVRPGNTSHLVPLFDEVTKGEAVELVFFLLVRQVRQLIEVASDPNGYKGPSWLKSKLLTQANEFGLEGLLELHQQLYEIDMGQKTGRDSLSMTARLELMLMGI